MMRPVSSQRVERWLGPEAEALSRSMRGWYGPPILCASIPGEVYVTGDGDFVGNLRGGEYFGALDFVEELIRRTRRVRGGILNSFGTFGEFRDAVDKRSQVITVAKTNVGTTVQGASWDGWAGTGFPAAGSAGAAAPGGTVHTSANTGAIPFQNPTTGTMHFIDIEEVAFAGDRANHFLLYDRLFSVAKTMSSITTEAVTGVPTRYQATSGDDSAAGNFLQIVVTTTLGNTAHNWTVCQYTDQDGNPGVTLPTVTGVAQCAALRLDQSSTDTTQFWHPLAAGDTGIKALTQMQCSASVTGGVNFVIGHPIAMFQCINGISLGLAGNANFIGTYVSSGQRHGYNMPRIFDNACLAIKGNNGNSASEAITFTMRIASR